MPEHLGWIGEEEKQAGAACRQVVDINDYPTYTALKRIMATIDSDAAEVTVLRAAENVKSTEKLLDLAGGLRPGCRSLQGMEVSHEVYK